jgi:hypothetical protein
MKIQKKILIRYFKWLKLLHIWILRMSIFQWKEKIKNENPKNLRKKKTKNKSTKLKYEKRNEV